VRPPSENPLIGPGGGPDDRADHRGAGHRRSLLGIAGAFLAIPAAFQLLITRVVWPRLGQA
jgi:hypothetical protein